MTPIGRHPLDVAARRNRWGDDGCDGDIVSWLTGTFLPGPLPDSDMGLWRHMAHRVDGLWCKVLGRRAHPLTWDLLLAELARSSAHGVDRRAGQRLTTPIELRPSPRRQCRSLIPAARFPRLGSVGAR